jgi:iron complex outermembrane receptor protein
MYKKSALFAGVCAGFVALCSSAVAAEADAPADQTSVDTLIVTGTRVTGIKAQDSAAPIQVLGTEALERVGQPELIQSLAQNFPSFTAQAFGGDTANLTLSARLRGISPNNTLVLVNGKRRHGTANLAVLGGPYQGAAAADLNFIPVSSISHVEVLTDGAAAQYGTDAIAGVVNIILKKNSEGGTISVGGGRYIDEGGNSADVSVNFGLAPLGDSSYLNVTFESKYHGHSNRGAIDPRVYNHDGIDNLSVGNVGGSAGPLVLQYPGYPYVNRILGDARYHLNAVSYSAGYEFANGLTAYSFGTYGKKIAEAFENYRQPYRAPAIWPLGYNPKERLEEKDFAFTAGVSGTFLGWNADLSATYGKDENDIFTVSSANNVLANTIGLRQTDFYDALYAATQQTVNLDMTREFDVNAASPLTVAFGIEQRHDIYELGAGEPNSYLGSGAASFPGIQPLNAGSHSRDNVGVYIDFAVKPIEKLTIDIAARAENFSDFGNTTVGKFTTRYDFSDAFAIRGTISSGFRAPTLAEEFYSAVNVGPTTAFGQFGPNSAGSAALGFGGLQPEQSTNYSVGFVAHPISAMAVTLDVYQIDLKDRIVGSGNIYGLGNPTGINSAAVQAALVAFIGADALDGVTQSGINIFANGLDTRTKGADLVVTYATDFGSNGKVDWSLTGSYNTTEVTHIKPSPASFAPQELYDISAISSLEDSSPKYRIVAGALWTVGPLTINLRENLYGESSHIDVGDDGVEYKSTISSAVTTDIEFSYEVFDGIAFTFGANNLFNEYPDKMSDGLLQSYREANDNAAVGQYPSWSPFGINGGYYYGKIAYSF